MKIEIEIELSEEDVKKLVVQELSTLLNHAVAPDDVKIEVKSKQNYKSEWETAAFRARVSK